MMNDHLRIFVEMQCSHCGLIIMKEVLWISFATSLYKGYTCHGCHKQTISTWQEVYRPTAQHMIEQAYIKNYIER